MPKYFDNTAARYAHPVQTSRPNQLVALEWWTTRISLADDLFDDSCLNKTKQKLGQQRTNPAVTYLADLVT